MELTLIMNQSNKSISELTKVLKEAIGKTPPNGNPLVSHKFGADPYPLIYQDRVYLYATNDEIEYDENGNVTDNTYAGINTLTVISSSDLVNWTDHGEILAAGPDGAAKWAKNSWAPAITQKVIDGKDKFFLYFANNGSNIGVLTADSPLGPWTDPIDQPIISRETPGVDGVPWIFDPAVLVDDDGTGYLYFGGGIPDEEYEMPNTARVIQLSDDMILTVGEAKPIPAPFMFESGGINKYNGRYYYSYCSNFYTGDRPAGVPGAGEIAYLTSDHPKGPWTYQHAILKNPGYFFNVSGNNHHAMFEFKGTWYISYHAQTLSAAMGIEKGYRSTHLNEIYFDEEGQIEPIQADLQGVEKVKNLNPYETTEAVTMAWQAGINVSKPSDTNFDEQDRVVSEIKQGAWLAVSSADFEHAAKECVVHLASETEGASIEVRLDSIDGEIVGQIDVPNTGGKWIELSFPVEVDKGIHGVYFVFKGDSNQSLFELASWSFNK
ncbi:family 43 glycosylhydrolase [Gracilibacillus salitolerans]|uniref:Family 43 glycosylhydrolase n=2 Tax=Gracilibacillus salitolerans TaxID=2663022 RepID=A0A5Q2TFQ1_9BACI|nr:family 43 glycosylhydrolase [Gracilibacillus salitolerans]